MQVHLIAAGTRMPRWVTEGYDEYARRLPHECRLQLREIPLGRRRGGDTVRAVTEEGDRMLAALSGHDLRVVALAVDGRAWSTEALARQLDGWLHDGRDLALLIGGPDGLATACRERAEFAWSLSPLTLPHGLVRVLVAEQLYRAWSILAGHPYHRG